MVLSGLQKNTGLGAKGARMMEWIALWLYISGMPLYIVTMPDDVLRKTPLESIFLIVSWPVMPYYHIMFKLLFKPEPPK